MNANSYFSIFDQRTINEAIAISNNITIGAFLFREIMFLSHGEICPPPRKRRNSPCAMS
jgi:hypothetical protein